MTRVHNAPVGLDAKEGEAYGLVLGQVIAQLRKQHGNMTQAELARRLGISQSMLSKIESGKQPDAYQFSQIAQVFGFDVQQLNAQVLDAMQRAQQAVAAVTRQSKAASGWGELLALAGFVGLVMFAVAAVVESGAKPIPEPEPGPNPEPKTL